MFHADVGQVVANGLGSRENENLLRPKRRRGAPSEAENGALWGAGDK